MDHSYPPRQQTLAAPIRFHGIGLHTGVAVSLTVSPARANTGIVFKRSDLDGFEIKAKATNVARVSYATMLMRKGVLISTTEHLLSALAALGVDNVVAEMDNLEVPILDGSASPFVREMARVGLRRQRARRVYLQVVKPVEVVDGAKRIAIYPSPVFRITYHIDFPQQFIGRESLDVTPLDGIYTVEIAPARTFTTLDQVEGLRKAGLIRGGSLENAVVVSRDGVMNPEGLRFRDEFCRHKILDLVGDLALLGRPVVGHVVAHCAGHAMHYALVSRLLAERKSWRLVDSSQLVPETSAA
jgi:UDP-3-O-[3-hydroxymyristoyl] N-acetylglucosamine deacetylase